jgi:hypothetical protein
MELGEREKRKENDRVSAVSHTILWYVILKGVEKWKEG